MAYITEWSIYTQKLENIFQNVKKHYENNNIRAFNTLTPTQKKWLQILVDNIESQKSVVAVTLTSLLKKIVCPKQDIRLHREEFQGGYSGRSLDTNVVTPWLKKHFPRFAPKESGWLTRSIEQPKPFTPDFPGKIRNKDVKHAFLSILNDIEENSANPTNYMIYLLYLLFRRYQREKKLISKLSTQKQSSGPLTIDIVVNLLRLHFSMEQASRLPVIAVYTIYQIFMQNIKIYQNKALAPLKTHTTSDKYKGFGDIEIYNSNNTPFEVVEIKHQIPIDEIMLLDVLKKIKNTSIKKYYILTTAEPNFNDSSQKIFQLVHSVKSNYDIEIIPNGIYPSLKYYLRLVPDLKDFLTLYTTNLRTEFEKTADIKEFHIKGWLDIRQKWKI